MTIPSRQDLPVITVLVVNYNGKKYLEQCLNSLLTVEYPKLKVVVLDNASTDNSIEFVRKNYPNIETIQFDKNMGYAGAINLAMESVESEYVAFLNNDIIVEPNLLRHLISYMNMKRVAAVNPKILSLNNKEVINAAGGICDIYGLGWNRGIDELDSGKYDVVEEVFYAIGAVLLTKKDVWNDVGPFDERFFMYGEDLDWCWRARVKGYRILYVPSARIYHYWHGSGGSMIKFLENYWLASFLKNYSLKTILVLIPRYLSLKFLEAIWLMKNRKDINEKFAVFRSFLWNLVMFRDTWARHLLVQASRRVSDKEIQKYMYKGSFELAAWTGKIKHPLLKRPHENRIKDHSFPE